MIILLLYDLSMKNALNNFAYSTIQVNFIFTLNEIFQQFKNALINKPKIYKLLYTINYVIILLPNNFKVLIDKTNKLLSLYKMHAKILFKLFLIGKKLIFSLRYHNFFIGEAAI